MKTPFFLFILIILSSCSAIVDVELEPHESLISAFCLGGSPIGNTSVCLGYSKGINDEGNPGYLGNAEIILKKNGTPLGTSFFFQSDNGCYEEMNNIQLLGEGDEYYLEINHPDYETVFANQIVPKIPEINEVIYEATDNFDPLKETSYDKIKLRFSDDINTEDYYHVEGFIRNICCEEDFYAVWTWSDNFLLEETVSSQGLIFTDDSFNGIEMSLNLKLDNTYIEPDNHYLYIRFSKITKDRYLYLKTKKAYYDAEGNPFSEPVTIHSNINGGFGVFGLEAVNMYLVE